MPSESPPSALDAFRYDCRAHVVLPTRKAWTQAGLRASTTASAPAASAVRMTVSALPFFFAGCAVTLAITRLATEISKLYLFDLAGAARLLDVAGGSGAFSIRFEQPGAGLRAQSALHMGLVLRAQLGHLGRRIDVVVSIRHSQPAL